VGVPTREQGPGDRGFPEKAIAQFSSHRAQIAKTTLALAEEYEKKRWHAPDQQALVTMRQFANAMTRRCKEPGALDFARLLREGEQNLHDAGLGMPRDLARTVWRAALGGSADARAELARMAARLASRGELTHMQERAAMAAGLAQAQESRAARSRAGVVDDDAFELAVELLTVDAVGAFDLAVEPWAGGDFRPPARALGGC
jgi:hypothetical protein